MKKIYPLVIVAFLLSSCSKDSFKSYDRRIVGTWQLVDVDRSGFGGSISHLPFQDGQFIFGDNGDLTVNLPSGASYKGSWDIRKEWRPGNCDGNGNCDREVHTLFVTAVDFISQDIKSENFDEMEFTSTNHFKAHVNADFHTYSFRFRRN
jgi:hypothetical protein